MVVGSKVVPVSGAWPCGCEDGSYPIVKIEVIDDETMVFIGTSCGWQWYPIVDIREVH